MRMLDLFSGIGGFALAASWVWGDELDIAAFCEIDPFCRKVLQKHWPDVPIIEDIRDVTYESIANTSSLRCNTRGTKQSLQRNRQPTKTHRNNKATIDLLTGGFPCQPFSCAGQRKGAADNRFLWPEMLRVIREIQPSWIIGENVAGIINMALDQVLSDLENEDYACQAFIIPACAVDAPHRRDRVWIVANRNSQRQQEQRPTEPTRKKHQGPCGGDVANAEKTVWRRPNGKSNTRWGDTEVRGQGKSNRRVQHWCPEPSILRTPDGVSQKLDGGRLDGQTKERRSDKTLQVLRKKIGTKSNKRTDGRQGGIPRKGLLQQKVHVESVHKADTDKIKCWETLQTPKEKTMRDLQRLKNSLSASHRQEPQEQSPIQFNDAVQFVSHKIASKTGRHSSEERETAMFRLRQAIIQIGYVLHSPDEIQKTWKSIADTETDWVIMASLYGFFHSEWPDIPRVATGIKSRVDRLKSLGNAIVPQCVAPIMEAIRKNLNNSLNKYR